MEPADYTAFQDFNAYYQYSPPDAALFAAGNRHHHSVIASHHHQPNTTFWAVENQPQFVPTVNQQQQYNDFLVAGNLISTNNLAVINGNNVHVNPGYTDNLLESEFDGLSLAPTIRPTGFLAASSYEVGSSSSGSQNYSIYGDTNGNGVYLSQQQPQLRDIQGMTIQSAARGQVEMYMQPQINSGFEGFNELIMDPDVLNEIWNFNIPNQPNLYNNSAGNMNGYNRPRSQSFGNGFGSSSYDLGVESLLNSSSNMNGSGNRGDFQYRSLAAEPDPNETSAIMAGDWRNGSIYRPRRRSNFTSLRGKLFSMSKDQQGCRFLQEKLERGEPEEVKMIIMEIKDHICEVMVDQFGRYLVPKYLAACKQNQQLMNELLLLVIKDKDTFRDMCVNVHGSRSVQKLLEHLTTQKQRSVAISVLSRITLPLTKSMDGHHVILYCLKHFTAQENKHILNELADNCVEIALDKSGCCVLPQCVDHAERETRERLIAEITSNALLLSEHPYGNYLVQYILDLKLGAATANIMAQLSGSFVSLSMSKFGSNVVEKFLKDQPEDDHVEAIVRELLHSDTFLKVVQDPFGNYVAQSAFRASKGAMRIAMIHLIHANYDSLQSHPHGKRVLSCIKGNRSRV